MTTIAPAMSKTHAGHPTFPPWGAGGLLGLAPRPRSPVLILNRLLTLAHMRGGAGPWDYEGDEPERLRTSRAADLVAGFEPFVRRHERSILNYLWQLTGNEQTAYDLTQEVFIRAWQHYSTVAGYHKPEAWLFRVATNLGISERRKRAQPIHSATSWDDALHPASSDPARRIADSELVRLVLGKLSPQRRAALVLREVYGFSGEEIAATLDTSVAAVKMALMRGREQFRTLYRQAEEGHQ